MMMLFAKNHSSPFHYEKDGQIKDWRDLPLPKLTEGKSEFSFEYKNSSPQPSSPSESRKESTLIETSIEKKKSPLEVDDSFFASLLMGLKDNKRMFTADYAKEAEVKPEIVEPKILTPHIQPVQYNSTPVTPNTVSPTSTPTSTPTSPITPQIHIVASNASITPFQSQLGSRLPTNPQTDRTRDMRWKEHFAELLRFKKEYGHTNVTQTKSKTLAEWVKNQRRLRKAGKLSQSRIEKLDEIGFEWDRSYLFKNKRTDRPEDEVQPTFMSSRKRKLRYNTSDLESEDSLSE